METRSLPRLLTQSKTGQAPSLPTEECPAGRLLRAVPMHHLHFVSRFPQPLAYIFGDHHRAVLSAGASEADGQVTLALANVVRQQVDQQLGDAINELLRLRKRPDVFRDPRIPSRQPTKLGHEVRIGQKAHIKHQVGIFRYAVFVSETHARDQNGLLAPRLLFEAVGQVRPQFMNIELGSVDDQVGGDAPISVQSMTTTKTADVEGTLQQIYALAANGADIVRCTCNEQAAAEGLAQIVPRSPVPIVADIHFHVEMALAALEAGVQGLRLNPGNLRKPEEIKLVASEARDRGVPIRIGVNAGSLHPDIYERFGGATPEALVESARIELAYFDEVGFSNVKISVKASSVATMIAAYRLASVTFDHPLHLGVTDAGPLARGLLKGTAGIATLLAEGIGDTLRYSLTADPVEEARAGRQLLESLGLRERKGLDLIACPSCGRAEVDVIKVANEAQVALSALDVPIQVAVMGCVVNGPGEAKHADLGIAAGKKRGHLFIKGQIVRVVKEDEMVEALVEEATKIVAEGVEARLAARDHSAEAEAEADRAMLLDDRGADVNHASERIEKIRRRAEG